jgi:hypothetical protein
MSLVLPKQNEFESVPAGSYGAVCYRVVDLGTQFSAFYKKASHKIMISWELDEKMKDGRPFSIHKRYTLSSGKNAALRKDLESWRGRAFTEEEFGSFDIGKLIGIGCMIGVSTRIQDGQTYSDVSSIMKLPKGMETPKVENEKLYFSLNEFNQDIYDKLSDGMKAVIAKSPEYQEIKGGPSIEKNTPDGHEVEDFQDSSIPF